MSSVNQTQPTPDYDSMRVHRPLGTKERVNAQADVEQMVVSGREYLVFPLIAAREMVLDYPETGTRELLPARHLQESLPLWDGTPITFIHPENERRTADDPREYTQTIIGQAYQPELKDNEKLLIMAYIDVEKARDLGGLAETVVNKLKAGEPLGVSAGYATLNDDRTGGNFHGEDYDIEQGYIIPDHIAIFPNDEFTARCDWEDGCGAPRMNYTVTSENAEIPDDQRIYPDHQKDRFESEEAAEARAAELGCEGTHTHPDDEEGEIFMPCESHFEYEEALAGHRNYRLSACEVQENYQLDRETAEKLRTKANETVDPTQLDRDSLPEFHEGDMVEVQSLPGVVGRIVHIPDGPMGIAMVDLFDEGEHTITLGLGDIVPVESDAESEVKANISEGQYVQWDWVEGTAYGQVVEIVEDGERSVDGNVRSVNESDDERIAVIQQYSDDGEPQSQQVIKLVRPDGDNEDNLRSWDAPAKARENVPPNTEEYTLTRAGEYVTWDTGSERLYGVIAEVTDDGCLQNDGYERCVQSGQDTRLVRVEQYTTDGEPTGNQALLLVREDGPNEGNLRSWNAPRSARQNIMSSDSEDPATLFQRFLNSIGVKANAAPAEGAEELIDEVSESEDTEESDVDVQESESESDEGDTDPESETDSDSAETETPEDDNQEPTDADDTATSEDAESDEDAGSVKENTVEDAGGDDSEQETETDAGETSDDNTDMKVNEEEESGDGPSLELEDIAAKTAFGISELEEMDDQMVAALERTVIEMSSDLASEAAEQAAEGEEAGAEETAHKDEYGDKYNTDSDTEPEQTENTMDENEPTDDNSEENTVNTDQFLTTEEAEAQFASKEDVNTINENVEQIKGMVQNIQTEQEDEQKEEKARMVANAIEGMSVEAAKQLPEEELDTLAETHATRTNYAAVPGQRGQIVTNTQSSEDIDDYPAGGRTEWKARKAEGGD